MMNLPLYFPGQIEVRKEILEPVTLKSEKGESWIRKYAAEARYKSNDPNIESVIRNNFHTRGCSLYLLRKKHET